MRRKQMHEPRKPKPAGLPKDESISERHEKSLAQAVKGHKQPASGAFPGAKGDVKRDDFLFEAKATEKKSMSIKREWLEKIDKQATGQRRLPALEISFSEMAFGVEAEWIMIPRSVWIRLVDGSDG